MIHLLTRGSYTVFPLSAGLCMACLPQCPTHLPHSIHFSGSMTGSPNPDCVIAPTGQTVSSGHRWFCGQRRLSTVSAMPVYLLSSTLSMASLSDALGRAPCAIWGLPLVGMKSSVGIERMPNAAASSCSSSVFTL